MNMYTHKETHIGKIISVWLHIQRLGVGSFPFLFFTFRIDIISPSEYQGRIHFYGNFYLLIYLYIYLFQSSRFKGWSFSTESEHIMWKLAFWRLINIGGILLYAPIYKYQYIFLWICILHRGIISIMKSQNLQWWEFLGY